jgi:hypothetical protein
MLRQHEDEIDAAFVIASLEDATMTALALPAGFSTRMAQSQPDVVQDITEAYGYSDARIRRAIPGANKITAMDLIFSWLPLIKNRAKRRIVCLRAITHFGSGKPKSWRSIADLVGADPKSVQGWHAEAIAQIVAALGRDARAVLPQLER